MAKLLIVESPGKVQKIRGFLGTGWEVAASFGHVRDLPKNKIGVEAPDFVPQYEATEQGAKSLAKLTGLAKNADEVYLATDADREGEGIAWHLKEALRLKDPKRVTFTEITAKAVKEAVANPRRIDNHLVAAQGCRRVLDRLVGYMASRPLSDITGQAMSAGRVQSPAIRLVVERERAIRGFKVANFYEAVLRFALPGDSPDTPRGWTASWDPLPFLRQGEAHCTDRALAERVAAVRDVTVVSYKEGTARRAPPAPFTTSTFQQAAFNRLKLTPEQSMQIAQKLYEQGRITYMRTDSTVLSAEALKDIAEAAARAGLQVVKPPRSWTSKAGAQEAHEAIRPTHMSDEKAGTTPEEMAVYELIWKRTLACQCPDAQYATKTASLVGALDDGTAVNFKAVGRTLTTPGWLSVTGEDAATADDAGAGAGSGAGAEADNPVPKLTDNQKLKADSGTLLERQTKPPARYNQASLVRALEKEGIGRPSTYASIMNTIKQHEYVEEKAGKLYATTKAAAAVDALVAAGMSFVDLGFTRGMEDKLDDVAAGKLTYRELVRGFHAQLLQELQQLQRAASPNVPACPVCGKPMRKISMPNKTPFYGCTGYPTCKKTMPAEGAAGSGRTPPPPPAPPASKKKGKRAT